MVERIIDTRMRILLAFLICCVASGLTTQLYAQDERTIEEAPERKVEPRKERFAFMATTGLVRSFVRNGTNDAPTIQAAASYYLTPRLSLGMSFGRSEATGEPFVDPNDVKSYLSTTITHFGARVTGSMVRTGPLELYGGLQLGINGARSSQRHEFPSNMQVENEAEYIAERPDPFGETRSQLSATGFLGMTVEVLPHVHAVAEVGNNLSLLAAGVGVRF